MDSITGIDGKTIDPARIFFCIVTLEYMALAAFAVVNNLAHFFDLLAWSRDVMMKFQCGLLKIFNGVDHDYMAA